MDEFTETLVEGAKNSLARVVTNDSLLEGNFVLIIEDRQSTARTPSESKTILGVERDLYRTVTSHDAPYKTGSCRP